MTHMRMMCGGAAAMLATMLVLAGSAPAAARELKLNHQFGEGDARHRSARVLAAEVRKHLPDLTVSVHPKSSLGIAPEKQLDALLEGKIDLAIFPMGYGIEKFPELAIASMPAIPASAENAALLRGSEFEDLFQAFCAEKGFRVLAWWWFDGGMASRKRRVSAPATIKGLAARSGGGEAFHTVLAAAGARIVRMSADKMNESMQNEALEVYQGSYEALVNYKLHEVAEFATIGGYSAYVTLVPVLVSKATWDSLDLDSQALLQRAADASTIFLEQTQREAEELTAARFAEKKAKVEPLTFEDYAAWAELAKNTAWQSYRKVSPKATELMNAMLRSFINARRNDSAPGQPPPK
ncbi:MAG: TRAP transporter substrate-binding protein DctP [Hyphomicrobiaceae bacterium]|nr:TRAP transporter substrate-binding protein DctP [Hyphomicrobiaceae bacterium]